MLLKITIAVVLSTSTNVIHSFAPQVNVNLSNKCYSRQTPIYNSVADESYILPIEDEDAKVTGRKWGMSWGADKIPILRRKKKSSSTKDTIVETVSTLEEYKEFVADETEQIVVVRFYASWCRACKAIKPEYYKLANELPNIKFVEVPLTQNNAFLHQGLGVPSLPYGHIYHPAAGLVEEMSVSKKNFRSFKNKLNSYIIGSCDVDDAKKYTVVDSKDVVTRIDSGSGVFE